MRVIPTGRRRVADDPDPSDGYRPDAAVDRMHCETFVRQPPVDVAGLDRHSRCVRLRDGLSAGDPSSDEGVQPIEFWRPIAPVPADPVKTPVCDSMNGYDEYTFVFPWMSAFFPSFDQGATTRMGVVPSQLHPSVVTLRSDIG
jgi:hypothetical protein